RLHPLAPCRVHWGEVRVGHDHLMAEFLHTPRHPLALRRRLDQHARLRPLSQHRRKSLSICLDPPFFNNLSVLPDNADLAIHLVNVDTYTLHGWPPSPGGFDRVLWSFQLPRWSGGQPLHPIYPFSALDSKLPTELWSWMDAQRKSGNELLAISHNANVSDG